MITSPRPNERQRQLAQHAPAFLRLHRDDLEHFRHAGHVDRPNVLNGTLHVGCCDGGLAELGLGRRGRHAHDPTGVGRRIVAAGCGFSATLVNNIARVMSQHQPPGIGASQPATSLTPA